MMAKVVFIKICVLFEIGASFYSALQLMEQLRHVVLLCARPS